MKMNRGKGEKGYTLIELVIVIGIMGILAMIVTLQYTSYRVKAYNSAANADARNAYTAAQGYFIFNSGGEVTDAILEEYGYHSSDNVSVTMNDGTKDNLSMSFKHVEGDITYTVDASGFISSDSDSESDSDSSDSDSRGRRQGSSSH